MKCHFFLGLNCQNGTSNNHEAIVIVKGARPRKGIMNLLLVSLTADSDDRVAESKDNKNTRTLQTKQLSSIPSPVIPSKAKDSIVFPKKSITFALESSQGIRVEGMTTLSRQLDSSPKVSVPGWLYFFLEPHR